MRTITNIVIKNGRPAPPECPVDCWDLGLPRINDSKFLINNKIVNFSATYNSDFKMEAKWTPVADAKLYFINIHNEGTDEKKDVVCFLFGFEIAHIFSFCLAID